jgi:hypothetical protein
VSFLFTLLSSTWPWRRGYLCILRYYVDGHELFLFGQIYLLLYFICQEARNSSFLCSFLVLPLMDVTWCSDVVFHFLF